MNITFFKANLANILIISFLGIALILSIIFGLESLATAIIGAFIGYMSRHLQDKAFSKNKRSDVQ